MRSKYWFALQVGDYPDWDIGTFGTVKILEMARAAREDPDNDGMPISILVIDQPNSDPFCLTGFDLDDLEDVYDLSGFLPA